ncbi:galactose ABC transporter substrate-binding protein [Lachnospiraceae bacterium OttesenSCG-928-E19]|nr:galactose ABC transporter substrate-binding protein [Lachnospiraceae bacterium OttesenSCG-928-E19]
MKMKKLVSVMLVIAMAAMLAVGCSSGKDSGSDSTEGEKSGTSGNVHVFYYSYGDTFISTVRTALDAELDNLGVAYTDYDGNTNQQTQTEQVQTALTSGANLLVVNLVETGSDDAAYTIVNAAKEKDVPVIFFNREVSDEVVNSYDKCSFIGTLAEEAGQMQGEMIGEYLVENFDEVDLNGDGKISYAMFKGQEGNKDAAYRTQYAVEEADRVLEEAGKEVLSFYDDSNKNKYQVDQDGAWSAKAAQDYMATALGKYNDANNNMIELVICNNDGMAEGAIAALQTVGYNKEGGDKAVPVFGVDATEAAKSLIEKEIMVGTIKQDAEKVAEVITLVMQNGLDGKEALDGITDYPIDEGVAKIRIPYEVYLGE